MTRMARRETRPSQAHKPGLLPVHALLRTALISINQKQNDSIVRFNGVSGRMFCIEKERIGVCRSGYSNQVLRLAPGGKIIQALLGFFLK